jgi:WG containing repeat
MLHEATFPVPFDTKRRSTAQPLLYRDSRDMYPRRDDGSGLYGYWGSGGWVIDPRFDYACRFYSGYAAVRLVNQRYGLIGKDRTFHPLDAICGGRKPIRDKFFSGFVDFNSGPSRYASVCTANRGRREWGLIDTSLTYKPLPNEVFSAMTGARPYGNHVVLIRSDSDVAETTCGLFNLDDMQLELPCNYTYIYTSNESLWVVTRTTDDPSPVPKSAFYDLSKREIVSDWFWGALPFSCGLGAVNEGGGPWYFVDGTLRPAFDAEFDDVGRFSCGLAAVYLGDDAGYIDTAGRMRLLLPYDVLQPFNEFGLAIANRDELEWDIDIVDREGRPRVAGLDTAEFWEGDFSHFQVSKDGKEKLIDVNLRSIY